MSYRICVRQRIALPVEHTRQPAQSPLIDCGKKRVERFAEQGESVLEQPVGDVEEGDTRPFQCRDDISRVADVLFERRTEVPVIAERIQRCGRDRVHRFSPDQLLHIADVPVLGVLRARARP